MTNDRILQKEEFIQQFVFQRISHRTCGKTCVTEALRAWNAIRKECDK